MAFFSYSIILVGSVLNSGHLNVHWAVVLWLTCMKSTESKRLPPLEAKVAHVLHHNQPWLVPLTRQLNIGLLCVVLLLLCVC